MKVNFRNRKLHLNFPKDQFHKPHELKDTINQQDQNGKVSSLGNSAVRTQSGLLHDRV